MNPYWPMGLGVSISRIFMRIDMRALPLEGSTVHAESMAVIGRRLPGVRRLTVPLVSMFAGIAAITTLIATRKNPGLSPDSVEYIVAGLNLADGNGLTKLNGSTLAIFAPGLPTVIALGKILGFAPEFTIRLLNATAFALVVTFTYVLLNRHVSSRLGVLTATGFVALSSPLLSVMDMAWSEPPFLALSLMFVVTLEDAISGRRRIAALAASVALAWLAMLFRYAGLMFVPIGTVILIAGLWHSGRRVAFGRAGIFAVCAGVPALALIMRRVGRGDPSPESFPTHLHRIFLTVGRWFWFGKGGPVPEYSRVSPEIAITLTALGGLVIFGTAALLWRLPNTDRKEQTLLPLSVFTGGYTLLLLFTAMFREFNDLDTRLLSPIYAPLVILMAIALDRLWTRFYKPLSAQRTAKLAASSLLALAIGAQAFFFLTVAQRHSTGVGYEAPKWQGTALAEAVIQLDDDARIFSNDATGLWFQTHREPLFTHVQRESSARSEKSRERIRIGIERLRRSAACSPTYLVWYSRVNPKSFIPPQELESIVRVDLMKEEADGALYRLGPKIEGPTCPSERRPGS